MIKNYGEIIKQLEDEIFSFINEFEDEKFIFNGDFMRFKFKTGDELPYNQKIKIPVCVISLSSVIKRKNYYYPNFRLQKCFYETESL